MTATALAPVLTPESVEGGLVEGGLVERVQAAIAEANLTQAAAATEIGISDAALSQWLRGRYPGDDAAVARKAERWLTSRIARAELEAQLPEAPAWVETHAATRVLSALNWAQMAGDIAVVYGGSGCGKTVSAQRYAESRPNVWLATMTAGSRTIGPCLERCATAAGIRHIPSRSWRIESALVDRVRGSAGLLIVDEAQHLDVRALEGLRGIHDAAGIGLALLGSELVYARLTGGGRSASYAQLFSRVGRRVRLGQTGNRDADAIAAAWGIEDQGVRQAVRKIARTPGALRSVTKALRLAGMMVGGGAVRREHLLSAQRELGAA